jgi:predicted RNA-binding Zn-ribbon protein involved in translation (DUF1610 family)
LEHIFTFKMLVLNKKPNNASFLSKDNLSQSTRMDPFVSGKGFMNYNCGNCGHTLLKSLQRFQITNTVYKCPKCNTLNTIKT